MMTAEGSCYRVDLRLRPDGTMGELVLPLAGGPGVLPSPRARLGAADADQGPPDGRRDQPGARLSQNRRAADLSDHHGFLQHRARGRNARPHSGEAAPPVQTRNQRQARPRRHSRHRIPGAVLPEALRRQAIPGCAAGARCSPSTGCATRAICRCRITAGSTRLISFCAPSNTCCRSKTTARSTLCPRTAKRWILLTRKVRAKLLTRPERRNLSRAGREPPAGRDAKSTSVSSTRSGPRRPFPARKSLGRTGYCRRVERDFDDQQRFGRDRGRRAQLADAVAPPRARIAGAGARRSGPAPAARPQALRFFLNKIVPQPGLLREFEKLPALVECVADLIEHSPYLAENLIRYPEDVLELKTVVSSPNRASRQPARRHRVSPPQRPSSDARRDAPDDRGRCGGFEARRVWLRRFYRRRMLQLQAESIFRGGRSFPLSPRPATWQSTSSRPHTRSPSTRIAAPQAGRVPEPLAGHRPRPAGHARVRPGLRRRPRFRVARRGRRRKSRGGSTSSTAHRDHQQLHRRGHDLQRRCPPAADGSRRRAGADRVGLQELFRRARPGLGGAHLHEVPSRRRRPRAWHGLSHRAAGCRLAPLRHERRPRAPAARYAQQARARTGRRSAPSRPARAATTTSTSS